MANHEMYLTYGDTGGGKTIDTALAFPHALFVGNPRGLISCERFDLHLRNHSITRLKELPTELRQMNPKPTAIVFDDLTLAAGRDVRQSAMLSSDLRKIYGAIVQDTLNAIDCADSMGIPICLNAHTRRPTNYDGVYHPGGPDLPGKQLSERIPPNCELSMRVVPLPERPGWGKGYQTSPEAVADGLELENVQFLVKSRLQKVRLPPVVPMNLGELLRANQRDLPRTHAWMEPVVEALSKIFAEIPDQKARIIRFWQKSKDTLVAKFNATPAQLEWVLRDAIDRTDLRAMVQTPLANFGVTLDELNGITEPAPPSAPAVPVSA